jgi:peptidoglycan/LPS O-acetylase OafA/YrhL
MDFLRLLFASLVLLSHSFELIDGSGNHEPLKRIFGTHSFGGLAVAGFFVLSGYLISQSWERSQGPLDFLRKRVLRIYPGFVVAALITAFVFGPMGMNREDYFSQFEPWAFARGVLLLEVPRLPPTLIGNGAMWTIQSEFACYLLVGLLGLLGLARQRWAAPALLVALCAYLLPKPGLFAPAVFLGYFLAGVIAFQFRSKIRYCRWGVCVAALLWVASMWHPKTAWLGLCSAWAYLVFAAGFATVPCLQGWARRADLSYGTYLYGWPIQMSLIVFVSGIQPLELFCLSLPLALLCGWLSFKGIEQPFMRLRGPSGPGRG